MQPKTLTTVLAIACACSISSTLSAESDPYQPGFLSDRYQPPVILLQTPRPGVLQNSRPDRGGVRGYTAEAGSNIFVSNSPLPYGASLEASQDLVIVRPRENVPYIAISPWEPVTDRTIEELHRHYPWLRRTDSIKQDLRIARNQYLRERGYIDSVRTFHNDNARKAEVDESSEASQTYMNAPDNTESDAEPQLVIIETDRQESRRIASNRLKEDSVIRVRNSDDDSE
jgi:hypothetical protein